ncbi:Cadmium-transporting ATPase [Herminiimonas arsenicoxydans]|uniref:P-type Zn(2+) transporter n=1 Tax=Herminiimonas arsenicoxydans TaxID=204773 RepID=A4G2J2_HERAR|nr:Cadmium-transporting ATPase [Herminiimonas arsenicoxydans]
MAEIHRPQSKQDIADCCSIGDCQSLSNTATQPASSDVPSNAQSVQYRISNMDCPVEEKLIRNKLEGMNGVVRLDFNLMNRILNVHHRLKSLESVTTALKAIGMDAQLVDSEAHQPNVQESASLTAAQKILLAVSGVAALAAEVLAWTTHSDGSPLVIALAFISIATGGLPTLKKGWIALKTFTLNINFLMSLAVIGAMAIGQWPEAAMVVFLFAVAELIESLSLNRARNAVHGLLKLAPDVVSLQDANGGWQEKPVESAVVGDMMRVKPGERIALDGVVTSGESSVNQAPITGESMPVDKRMGDSVYAGSINERGLLDIKVSTSSGNSTLAKIVRVIEETQNNKAATQRFVDTFARYYTPAVVVMAILVAVIPPLIFGAEFTPWLYKALVMLVIACPCALVISTPVTVVSGLTAAARLGILIKGGEFLEVGYKLKAIALDKTGTLTAGQPSVVDVKTVGNSNRESILLLAASLDVNSDHPLANAIVKAGPESSQHKVVANFEALPGRGVKGEIDGTIYYLGNHRLIEELKVCSPAIEALLDEIEGAAQTAVMLATDKTVVGIIAVADSLRESAIEGVRQLNQLGITTVMLTGDNNRTAQQIGAQVGINVIKAELLPEDKLTEIKSLQSSYGVVGMLGDGINDAPALAQANVGFAMGAAGSDTAIETADVALMNDDLRKLPAFIKLSRATRSILIQNITAAIGIKAVFFILAFMGIATLWMAVFADVGASLLVVFNGLRLLRK